MVVIFMPFLHVWLQLSYAKKAKKQSKVLCKKAKSYNNFLKISYCKVVQAKKQSLMQKKVEEDTKNKVQQSE